LSFFHSCFATNVDDEHSVVHCIAAHPSCTQAQRSNNEAIAATNGLLAN